MVIHSAGMRSRKRLPRDGRRCLLGLCLSLWFGSGFAVAADANLADAQSQAISYVDASDEQLTALAARWDDLTAVERRALLSEVKMRMARSSGSASGRGAKGVLSIRLTRRYGAVPQGRTAGRLHIRVGKGPANAKEFGVGFEQRTSQRQAADQEASEQAVQAATPQKSDPG